MNLDYADIIFRFYDAKDGHKLVENTFHSHLSNFALSLIFL